MIRFEKVSKSFSSRKILDELDLEVKKGELFFVLGMSGTGKSVTLKHLVGLIRADSGKIYIDDEDLSQLKEDDFQRIRCKCGLVFQKPALLDSRNLYENISLGIRRKKPSDKNASILKVLSSVKLEHLKDSLFDRKPQSLSFGEQKRISLARTLVMEPEILLYDEPTTGLDPITSLEIHRLIFEISKNYSKTSLVVSHDIKNALLVADKIAILDKGKIADIGTPQEIRNSSHPLTKSFLEDLV
jgi:phospholipid/cholesterol/gamma-HCH transport system ATP-binding protein